MGTLLKPLMHKLRPGKAKLVLAPKQAKPFYLSREWKQLITVIKHNRGNRCYDPDHPLDVSRTQGRIYGDHVVEISDGGATLDPRNIMLRCHLCHQRKTTQQRTLRYHGAR